MSRLWFRPLSVKSFAGEYTFKKNNALPPNLSAKPSGEGKGFLRDIFVILDSISICLQTGLGKGTWSVLVTIDIFEDHRSDSM